MRTDPLPHHLLSVLSLVIVPGALAGQSGPLPQDSVRRVLEERIARGGAIGLVVGTLDANGPRVVAAGRRSGYSGPVDDRTVFEIGSVSKVFTTTLLAEMVIRGEVSLSDPIRRFLPDSVRVPARGGKEITLLDLATSTSGLPRLPIDFTPGDLTNPYADYGAGDLYRFLSGYTLPRDPGASYEYSNLGMGLLGHLLERRAGMPYGELVTERILVPLGMHDTRLDLTPDLRARLAAGHGADLEPAHNWDFDVLAGAGGWRSTARDMLRFLAAAQSPPPGTLGQAFRLAIETRRPTGQPRLQIGLGWHVLENHGREFVWHNGQTGGYHAFLGFDPATGANSLVLANVAADVDDIGFHLLDGSIPLRQLPAPRATVPVAADILERYVGRYDVTPAFSIAVTRQDSVLYVQATGQPRFRLFAASPTRFFLRVVEAEIVFLDDAGRVTGLVLHQGGAETRAARVP